MSVKQALITIGFDKNGEGEFGISCCMADLTLRQMNELREIIPVAIYVAEDMWHRAVEKQRPIASAKPETGKDGGE